MSGTQVYQQSILLHKPDSTLRRHGRLREALFMLALITLPFSAQGVEPYGITLEVSYLCVLAFSLIYFWNIPPFRVDRQDMIYLLFLFVAVISLGYNLILNRVATTSALGSGLRFSARQYVHLFRFIISYMIYKTFKEFLSTGDWVRRQHLFYKGLIAAAWIVAIYGSYQFFAQRFGWPLHNINNLHKVGAYATVHYVDDLRRFYTIFATFGETKTYGAFLLGMIPLLLGVRATMKRQTSFKPFLPVSKSSPRWLVVLIGTLILHLALGFSRTAYIAAALLILFIFLFISRKAAVAMCILALAFFVSFSLFIGKSPFSLLDESWTNLWAYGKTGDKAIERWKVTLREVEGSPLLGYGLGNVWEEPIVIVSPGRVTLWFSAPGVLGQLLPGVGILGTVPFLVFLASHVRLSLSNLRKLDREEGSHSLLLFSLVALVGAWAIWFIHFHPNATLPWIILAENVALNRIVERLDQKARSL